MTGKTRWMPRPDLAFVFTTVFVIVLANLPEPVAHQVIEVRSPGVTGAPQTYSLAVNDPRLSRLTRRVETYGESAPAAAIGKLKWMAETASLYAQRTADDLTKIAAESDAASFA